MQQFVGNAHWSDAMNSVVSVWEDCCCTRHACVICSMNAALAKNQRISEFNSDHESFVSVMHNASMNQNAVQAKSCYTYRNAFTCQGHQMAESVCYTAGRASTHTLMKVKCCAFGILATLFRWSNCILQAKLQRKFENQSFGVDCGTTSEHKNQSSDVDGGMTSDR